MNVKQTFDVAAPADEVFAALLDLERVAPCLPGAEGVEQTGEDTFTGGIRVRVGPITMRYRADIEILEKDEGARRAKLRVQARETKGQGTADAEATLTLGEAGGGTHGDVDVEVKLSGRAASMGQGAIQDVSNSLVAAFAANLGAMLSQDSAASVNGTSPAEPGASGEAASGAPADTGQAQAASAEAISGLGLAGTVIMGRARHHRAALLALAAGILLGWLLGRRGS